MSAQSAMEALAVTGSPGLAQGAYGEHGNLELVCPAAAGGFWVLWFDVEWHLGLHVPSAAPLHCVRVTQVAEGPRFLEVVGRAGTSVHRQFWTPTDGFVAAGQVAVSEVDPSRVVAHGGGFHLLCQQRGSVVLVTAATAAYPTLEWGVQDVVCPAADVTSLDLGVVDGALAALVVAGDTAVLHVRGESGWRPMRTLPGRWREAVLATPLVAGLDEHGRVVWCGTDGALVETRLVADAVTATTSTLDGGALEIVTRTGTALRHTRVAGIS